MTAAARHNPLDDLIRRRLGRDAYCREDLERHQWESLRATVLRARAKSPFYRARLPAEPPACAADLHRLPFTSAADLAADPAAFVCVPQDEISRIVSLETSGTTGRPKRLYFTAADQEITLDYFQYGLSSMAAAGDAVLVLLPRGNPGSLGDLLETALRRLDARALFADAVTAPEVMTRERPALVIGAPVAVLALARRTGAHGTFARRALLCADHIPEGIARFLETAQGCETFRDWGMTEMGYGGGVDCHAHAGYHLQEGDFLFEIVDAETGAPLPEGESGEIVLTTLTRRGMPLIRYRTGDVARFIPGACACGSPLRRLDRITARKAGRIALDGGELSQAALDETLFDAPEVADFKAAFQAGSPDRLRVTILSPDVRDGSAEADALARRLDSRLDGIAPIRLARTAGRLRVEVSITANPDGFGGGKRTIGREASE